jgi:AcrR family transcriptional regulator
MASTVELREVRTRRGGRTADVTRRIHDAVMQLLEEGGLDACTYPRVAELADIERSTLYRRYPDRWAMLGEVFVATLSAQLSVVPSGDFRTDLRSHVGRVARALTSPLGMAMLAAGALARIDPQSRQSAGLYWQARVRELNAFIVPAIERGELSADVDPEALIGTADGPLYFRLLIVGRPIDEELLDRCVDNVCAIYCRKPA